MRYSLKSCERKEALKNLGQALHTVQDIYSHTNAVDNGLVQTLLGDGIINMRNGKNTFLDGSPVCYAPNNFSPGTGELVSGFFSIPGWGSDGERGSCFGTTFVDPELIIFPVPPHPYGMCCHLDLNKDSENSLNGARTYAAQDAAYAATQNYIRIIYDEIDILHPKDAEYLKKMLKELQRRTIYVVDTTGSMEDDLNALKTRLVNDIDNIINDESEPATAFGLVTFKDEDEINGGEIICDLEEIKLQINSLTAYGGDDCPEASVEAVEKALDQFTLSSIGEYSAKGNIILHTDAPPSNTSGISSLSFWANIKGVKIFDYTTPGCVATSSKQRSNYTTAKNQSNKVIKHNNTSNQLKLKGTKFEFYQSLAENTGGINFNVLKSELDIVIPISTFITDPKTEVIYSQKHPVDSTNLTEARIKIDSSMATGKTMIMIKTIDAATLPTITLSRPNGDIALDTDADITINNLSTIVTYTIDSPTQGEWKVSLSNGTSTYLVRAFAQTDFGIAGLSLLKEAPLNIRQVPYMPIEGNPIAGDTLLLRVSLTQAPDTLTLKLLSENQTIIAEPVLTLVENSTKSYESSIEIMSREYKYYYGKS